MPSAAFLILVANSLTALTLGHSCACRQAGGNTERHCSNSPQLRTWLTDHASQEVRLSQRFPTSFACHVQATSTWFLDEQKRHDEWERAQSPTLSEARGLFHSSCCCCCSLCGFHLALAQSLAQERLCGGAILPLRVLQVGSRNKLEQGDILRQAPCRASKQLASAPALMPLASNTARASDTSASLMPGN